MSYSFYSSIIIKAVKVSEKNLQTLFLRTEKLEFMDKYLEQFFVLRKKEISFGAEISLYCSVRILVSLVYCIRYNKTRKHVQFVQLLCSKIFILFNHFKVIQMKYRKGKSFLLLTTANLWDQCCLRLGMFISYWSSNKHLGQNSLSVDIIHLLND